MSIRKRRNQPPPLEPVAGNGLLDRRALLGRGIVLAGAMTTGAGASLTGAAAEPLKNDQWSLETGEVVPPLQAPSRFEKGVVRTLSNPNNELRNSMPARRTICCRARSRPTACSSPSAIPACRTSIPPSTSSSSMGW